MAFYKGQYGAALQRIDTSPILQGAQAQAQMYQNLGNTIASVANVYFKKKEEDKQIEALADNEAVLNHIYGGRVDAAGLPVMPSDPKEVRKDIRALYRRVGPAGIEASMRADKAEAMAQQLMGMRQEEADRAKRAEEMMIQKDRDVTSYFEALTGKPPSVSLSEETPTPRATIGGVVRGALGGAADLANLEEASGRMRHPLSAAAATPGAGGDYSGYLEELERPPLDVPQPPLARDPAAGSKPSYLGGILRKIGGVEIPGTGGVARRTTTTPPGESLISRITEMTGPSFLEAFSERNPDATPGMRRLAAQQAAGMPQRPPESPVAATADGFTWLEYPTSKTVVPGSISTTTGKAPTFEQIKELSDRDTQLLSALESISRVMGIFKVNAAGEEEGEVSEWLVGPGMAGRGSRWLAKVGITGLQSDELLDNRDFLKQFATRTALEASQMLKGSLSEGELDLLMDAAPKMESSSREWRRYIIKLNKLITKEKSKNDRLLGVLETGTGTGTGTGDGGGADIRRHENKSADEIVEISMKGLGDPTHSSFAANARLVIDALPHSGAGTAEAIAKAQEILESKIGAAGAGKTEELSGGELTKIAGATVPTAKAIKETDLDDKERFIWVLSGVMRESIEGNPQYPDHPKAYKKSDFAGEPDVWYGEWPDPLHPENYKMLIEYAHKSGQMPEDHPLGLGHYAKMQGYSDPTPYPTDKSLFDYLNEFADFFEARTRLP